MSMKEKKKRESEVRIRYFSIGGQPLEEGLNPQFDLSHGIYNPPNLCLI